jgi:hypothetical protein
MDLDDTYQRGVVALGGELSSLQRDKTVRRNQAIGAINGAPRAGYQTNESKLMAIGLAGGSAYVQGQAMQGNSLFPSSEVLPRQIGRGAQHGRSAVTLRGAKSNAISSNVRNDGWDWRQRNPGFSYKGIGQTQYSKWGFGGDMRTARNYRRRGSVS